MSLWLHNNNKWWFILCFRWTKAHVHTHTHIHKASCFVFNPLTWSARGYFQARASFKPVTRGRSEGKEHSVGVKVVCARLWDDPRGVDWLSGKVVSNVGFILVMVMEFPLPSFSLTQASLTLLVLWWLLVWVPNTHTHTHTHMDFFFVFSSCLFEPVSELYLATCLTLRSFTVTRFIPGNSVLKHMALFRQPQHAL